MLKNMDKFLERIKKLLSRATHRPVGGGGLSMTPLFQHRTNFRASQLVYRKPYVLKDRVKGKELTR